MDLPAELTIAQAAEILGVHHATVSRYLAQGALIARDIAPPLSRRPTWRIPLDAVLEMRGAYVKLAEPVKAKASSHRPAPYTPTHFKMLD